LVLLSLIGLFYYYRRSKILGINPNDLKKLYSQSIEDLGLANQISYEQFRKDLMSQLKKNEITSVTLENYQDAIFTLLRNKYNLAIYLDVHWDPGELFSRIKKLLPEFEYEIKKTKIERYQENFYIDARVMDQNVKGEFEGINELIKKINPILAKYFQKELHPGIDMDDSYRFILVPKEKVSR
jgi:hypothetical protein